MNRSSLNGKKILVGLLDYDERMQVYKHLRARGAGIVGPVASREQVVWSLKLAPEGAILDAELSDGSSLCLIDKLHRQCVKTIVVGRSAKPLSEDFKKYPHIDVGDLVDGSWDAFEKLFATTDWK